VFQDCNFALANLDNAKLKNAKFTSCKLVGLDFSVCNDFLFVVNFENCSLDYATFFQKKLKNTTFLECSMKEVDFTECDLTQAVFHHCSLFNATFEQCILEKADFRTAKNYTFDPALNKMKKAKFSYAGIAGLLTKYQIEIS
jgi:fluoroquinolone resistance protein